MVHSFSASVSGSLRVHSEELSRAAPVNQKILT